MNIAVESILRNCVQPELVRDPDCWMWLNELQGTLTGKDAISVAGLLAEMRERRAKPKEFRKVYHWGVINSTGLDDSFEEWLKDKGCDYILCVHVEDEIWEVNFCSEGHKSFHDLVNFCKQIDEKFTQFGGEYQGWKFVGRFKVAHRVMQK
ncbi:ribonuclease E inhibitor RraB [Paraburkholderia tropica]|uniref:ribonuclease E inhibitor RraB n=1 Tax=Paraburkholderia tropica TaxID=92647 RepID=UPI0016037CEA|nr:ribonuclease E inhibitor RraB [Paraburkholderia tropica]QNB10291.1 ribonuclease E inhibitor RraB [Paraburkholderia tropica]